MRIRSKDITDTLEALWNERSQYVPRKRDLARSLGLEQRRMVDDLMPALGILSAGMLLGAGLAILFAPRAGRELRAAISNGMSGLRDEFASEPEARDPGLASPAQNL